MGRNVGGRERVSAVCGAANASGVGYIHGVRRGLTHRWDGPHGAGGAGLAGELQGGGGLTALAARLLAARGLGDAAAMAAFCEPRLTQLHDPRMLPGADEASGRLLDALRGGRRVVIYTDYDVDGVAGGAILFHVFRALAPGASVSTYIPHRLEEGYGLNEEALRRLRGDGAEVVVTVDCGITAVGAASVARRLGLGLIITDHHTIPDGPLPEAAVLAHPRLPGSAYPFGDLCGAAVAYKVAWRMATMACGSERVGESLRGLLLDMLALAALGTVADVVPLAGENRVIAKFGLARMRSTRIEGLGALVEASRLNTEKTSAEDVGFRLGPRLNAAGRMGHAREAMELLTVATSERARELAELLSSRNDARRATERAMFEQALERAEQAGMTAEGCRAVVLADERWHAGVLGIVCSRMVERHRRPTVLMRAEDGECHGSGRSVDGVNLHEALASCADLLEKFGGHDMAAGLTLRSDRLPEFSRRFTEHVNQRLAASDLAPRLAIDCEASIAEMTPRTIEQIERMAPFGRGNPSPVVVLRGLRLAADARPLGANGRHLELHVRQGERAARMVAWNWGEHRESLRAGMGLDAAVEPKISTWNGGASPEPVVRDIAPVR